MNEAMGSDGGSQLLEVWFGAPIVGEVVQCHCVVHMKCDCVVSNMVSEGFYGEECSKEF